MVETRTCFPSLFVKESESVEMFLIIIFPCKCRLQQTSTTSTARDMNLPRALTSTVCASFVVNCTMTEVT